jgi:hypothetical protein
VCNSAQRTMVLPIVTICELITLRRSRNAGARGSRAKTSPARRPADALSIIFEVSIGFATSHDVDRRARRSTWAAGTPEIIAIRPPEGLSMRVLRTRVQRSLFEGPHASRFEMTLREGSPRTGFQVALEADGPPLIGELDDDVKLPRSAGCCVRASPRVVVGQSRVYLGCEANIELWTLICISQNVDKTLVSSHGPTPVAIAVPRPMTAEHLGVPQERSRGCHFLQWTDERHRRFLPAFTSLRVATARHPLRVADSRGLPSRSPFADKTGPPSRRYGAASFACQRLAGFTEPKLARRASEGWWTRPGSNR